MAEDRMAVLDMLRKATSEGDVDLLREGVRVLAEAIMEAGRCSSGTLPRSSTRQSAGDLIGLARELQ